MTTRRVAVERRAKLVDEFEALAALAANENRGFSEAEQSRADVLKRDIEAANQGLQSLEFLENELRRQPGQGLAGGDRGEAEFRASCLKFSILRAVAHAAGLPNVDAGREQEVSAELARRHGAGQGILIPAEVFLERRAVTSTLPAGGPGGLVIPQDFRADLFIDLLRARLMTAAAGATILDGLTGNLDIPGMKTGATVGWTAENTALPNSDQAYRQVPLRPKHVGGIIEYSRNMLLQASPAVEQLARTDLAAAIAAAIDKGAISGAGGVAPTGILSQVGIGDLPTTGADGDAVSWDMAVDLATLVDTGNALNFNAAGAPLGSSTLPYAYAANAATIGAMKKTERLPGGSAGAFIVDVASNLLAGFNLLNSNNVPSNLVKGASGSTLSALIFGNWSDLLVGYWAAFDLLVNPFESAAYSKGNVLVRAMATMDVAVRHPESFAACKSIKTAP